MGPGPAQNRRLASLRRGASGGRAATVPAQTAVGVAGAAGPAQGRQPASGHSYGGRAASAPARRASSGARAAGSRVREGRPTGTTTPCPSRCSGRAPVAEAELVVEGVAVTPRGRSSSGCWCARAASGGRGLCGCFRLEAKREYQGENAAAARARPRLHIAAPRSASLRRPDANSEARSRRHVAIVQASAACARGACGGGTAGPPPSRGPCCQGLR